ncbi:uncharacterized protein Dana_GF20642, partial [Drosophila ananassae]
MYQSGQGQAQGQRPPSIRNISSAEKMSFNDCALPPPPPPPRGRVALPTRRTSSATEYAPMRDMLLLQQTAALAHQQHHPQQHRSNSHMPPERPPKHPHLRVPSPELPPPPQSGELDTSYTFDEPLPPPPPPEVLQQRPPPSPNRRNSFAGAGSTRRTAYAAPPSNIVPVAAKVPPLVPKKPTSLQHKHLANGVAGTGGSHQPTNNRKRPHHTPSSKTWPATRMWRHRHRPCCFEPETTPMTTSLP